MSHTPGPWVAHTLMVKARHETVCHLGTSNSFHPPRPEECVANARLIAAAPDLLAAAHRAVAALAANGAPNCEAAKELRIAIIKAES